METSEKVRRFFGNRGTETFLLSSPFLSQNIRKNAVLFKKGGETDTVPLKFSAWREGELQTSGKMPVFCPLSNGAGFCNWQAHA